MKKIAAKHQNQPFALIGIAMDEDVSVLRATLARKGITWPQICDGEGRNSPLTKLFNAWAFPRHFVLDRDGKIVFSFSGAKGVPKAAEAVAELLRN